MGGGLGLQKGLLFLLGGAAALGFIQREHR